MCGEHDRVGLTWQVAVDELGDSFPVKRSFRSVGAVHEPLKDVHSFRRSLCHSCSVIEWGKTSSEASSGKEERESEKE